MAKVLKKKSLSPNVQVSALAGTGKTTTLCWGAQGVPSGITLSGEQKPIIDQMQKTAWKTARFTAFSKAIATELKERLPESFECSTNHSLGLATIKANTSGKVFVDANKTWKILEENYGKLSAVPRGRKREVINAYNQTKSIVGICKSTLTGCGDFGSGMNPSLQEIAQTCGFYSVDCTPQTLGYAQTVLTEGSDNPNWVDFDDMVAAPHIHGFEPYKVDLGVVDECQDLNAAQLSLISRSARTHFAIGDVNQSIFGFAGADPEAISRIVESMKSTPQGYLNFPLYETRRCGKAIVEFCQQLVPEFKAHPNNQEGMLTELIEDKFLGSVQEDWNERRDVMILSRINAPLTSYALKLLKQRIPCYIKGRAFAQAIINLIGRLADDYAPVSELLTAVSDYETSETQKLVESSAPGTDQKLLNLQDRCAVISIFTENCSTVKCVKDKFNELFSDENKKNAICLSSAHRSKGLEADKVYIVRPDLLPHPKLAEKSEFNAIQERNVAYVAFSRAKSELVLIKDKI